MKKDILVVFNIMSIKHVNIYTLHSKKDFCTYANLLKISFWSPAFF